ncbi:MAG: AAA family ATPase [Bacteroidales bacterium]|nr:AAA family ATPase [Bacteroidales bacterium]
MEDKNIDSLYATSQRLIKLTTTTFKRYLTDRIDWDSNLIAIKGQRGVGKTTMLLQHIKETFSMDSSALYVSLDNLWFMSHSLTDVVEYHYNHGGTHIFIDEVHKYNHWQTVIKNIADEYPDLHIVYTGSSMLKIDYSEGDLSRRQIVYTLNGMSFREFLEFEGVRSEKAISLNEVLANHADISARICDGVKILPLFGKYLKYGFYPFYKKDASGFDMRLQAVVRQILNEDMPSIEDMTYPTIQKISKMLMILSERVPQTPNMTELYREIETNREQGLKMLDILERAGLIALLHSNIRNFGQMSKPSKILPGNPTLMYALTPEINIGTLRETFFYNQLSAVGRITLPAKGDFLVDNKYLFEVGGKNKTFNQIKDVADSYLAIDDIETGHHNKIPLWMFGMMY